MTKLKPNHGLLSPSLRYSHGEWVEGTSHDIQEADRSRFESTKVRGEAGILIEDRLTKTAKNQEEATKRIGERVREISEVIIELKQELALNEDQTDRLVDSFKHLEFVYSQTKRPLLIGLKCLSIREEKVDIENVRDYVEKYLKVEVDTIRNFQGRMKILKQLIEMQVLDSQEKQERLRLEIEKKTTAHDIDQRCHVLSDKSVEVRKFGGVELVEPEASVPATWLAECRTMVKESALAREVSTGLMGDVDTIIEEVAKELLQNWTRTNQEFKLRVSEIVKLREQLRTNVGLVEAELMEIHSLVGQLERARQSKEAPARLAQTRLQQRSHRPGTELCLDTPHSALVAEVASINESVALLEHKLREAEAARVELEQTRARLEREVRLKELSLEIDQTKCLTLRQNFPFTTKCSLATKFDSVDKRRFRVNVSA